MAISLPWDSKFEIGNERIDSEHRIFLSLIRDLSVESETEADHLRIDRTLNEIYKYADFHFISEENIMEDVGYPSFHAQRRTHRMLLAELDSEIHDFRGGRKSSGEIVRFLFQWFALHTTNEDKRIAEFIRR